MQKCCTKNIKLLYICVNIFLVDNLSIIRSTLYACLKQIKGQGAKLKIKNIIDVVKLYGS